MLPLQPQLSPQLGAAAPTTGVVIASASTRASAGTAGGVPRILALRATGPAPTILTTSWHALSSPAPVRAAAPSACGEMLAAAPTEILFAREVTTLSAATISGREGTRQLTRILSVIISVKIAARYTNACKCNIVSWYPESHLCDDRNPKTNYYTVAFAPSLIVTPFRQPRWPWSSRATQICCPTPF